MYQTIPLFLLIAISPSPLCSDHQTAQFKSSLSHKELLTDYCYYTLTMLFSSLLQRSPVLIIEAIIYITTYHPDGSRQQCKT